MKKLIIFSSFLFLFGCTKPNYNESATMSTSSKALSSTPGLEDCKLYEFKIDLNDYRTLKIVRCNNTVSTTETIPSGKTTTEQTVITINGKMYEQLKDK